jgi:mono/diheme cytochrome c family protein
MAFSPNTGLVYIPALDLPFSYAQNNAFRYDPESWNTGVDTMETIPAKEPDKMIEGLRAVKGHLAAWDPITQKEVWRVQHDTSWNGGLLSTAGNLIFQGRADGRFAAYRADTGELLWEFPTQIGIIAAPVTYSIDGEQYVSVLAGWGGAFALASGVPRHRGNVLSGGRLLTFKLGGKNALPPAEVVYMELPQPPQMKRTADQVARGEALYHEYCATCHGPGGISSGGGTADLRYANAGVHVSWDAIVRGGAYAGKGMASFASVLSEEDATAIQAYIVEQTENSIALCQSEYRQTYPELLESACARPQTASAP